MSNGNKTSGSTNYENRTPGHQHSLYVLREGGNGTAGTTTFLTGGYNEGGATMNSNNKANSNYDRIYLFSDDTETRPADFTKKIWVRTA